MRNPRRGWGIRSPPFLQHLTSPVGVKSSSLYSSTIPRRGGKGISNPRSVSRRVGKGFPTHGGISYSRGRVNPRGILRISHPRGVSRRVGKGFPTHGGFCGFCIHGVCQEGWEGIPHPRGILRISHPWGVSRRVGKGFPTHGKKGYLRMTILRVAE